MRTICTFLFCFTLSFVHAQDGTLDPTFGKGGKVISTFGDDYALCFCSAQQKDGKIITAGGGNRIKDGKFIAGSLIVRYLSNGSLDYSFGDSGRVISTISGDVHAVAVEDDGKIIIAPFGGIEGQTTGFILLRYNPDGSLDSSFGINGIVSTTFGFNEAINAIIFQKDKKIVVGGNRAFDFLVVRYLPDGTVDSSFGNKGYNITPFGGIASITSLALTQENKIVAAGYSNPGCALAQYLPNGMADTTFGSKGKIYSTFGFEYSLFHAVTVQQDGSIVAAGEGGTGFTGDMLAARYAQDGTTDKSFGTNGIAIVNYGRSDSRAYSVASQKDQKIVLIGGIYNAFNSNGDSFAVARLLPAGIPDETFGEEGSVKIDFGNGGESVTSGFIDDKDRVVIQGFNDIYLGVLLARLSGESHQQNILTRIKRYLQHHGITWQSDKEVRYYTVQKSTDGGVTYQPVSKLFNNHQPTLTYEDATATNDNALYRVAVVANNGSRSLSNSIAITREGEVKLFPNPVRSTLQLQGLPADGKSSVTVTDFNGTVRTSATASGGSLSINTAVLKPGNYLLKVQSGKTTTTQTFVKE